MSLICFPGALIVCASDGPFGGAANFSFDWILDQLLPPVVYEGRRGRCRQLTSYARQAPFLEQRGLGGCCARRLARGLVYRASRYPRGTDASTFTERCEKDSLFFSRFSVFGNMKLAAVQLHACIHSMNCVSVGTGQQ